ncbi:hypothetical protein SAMN02983003_0443 [Devosia enhydra]|uniref:DUF6898 domain-containing protein n=1 Tax=Devosia enhydra TaxID=665118 RepID=A0A1K2HUR9_9HYPH|nr:hypothetical protein [Devosia enhydra]SFZ81336.1 hypothetical protein SAMN02983003_0443 [Devosia enhydra]
MAMTGASDGPGKIYFEMRPMGAQLRVVAIDAATGIEVVVIAPIGAARSHIEAVATAKLRKRLAEAASEGVAPRLF